MPEWTIGSHRARSPEETWNRVAPILPDHGITRVADITRLDGIGIPVWQAIRPTAQSLSVSQGKGLSPLLARVSAVMEAIELHHSETLPNCSFKASVSNVNGLTYDVEQLALAEFPLYTRRRPIEWLMGFEIQSGRKVPIPRPLLDLSFSRLEWCPPLFNPTSNGLASGNTLSEATLHGILEVVERDCSHKLALTPTSQRRPVDLSAFGRDCAHLVELFEKAGVAISAWDATQDRRLPCFEVTIYSSDLPVPCGGAGCHVDASIALSRALTEAAQSRLAFIAGSRDDLPALGYVWAADPNFGTIPRQKADGRNAVSPLPSSVCMAIDEELAAVASIVATWTGVQPIVVDLTRPPHEVPVVFVIAPGLKMDSAHNLRTARGVTRNR